MAANSDARPTLVVEGRKDFLLLSRLAVSVFEQTLGEKDPPIIQWDVVDAKGKDNVYPPGRLSVLLKDPRNAPVGIVVDADDSAERRWSQILGNTPDEFGPLPQAIPRNGYLGEVARPSLAKRWGIWIMPDNTSPGMTETLIRNSEISLPSPQDKLWELATKVCVTAKQAGAPFLDHQRAKAELECWSAWQNPPDQIPNTWLGEHQVKFHGDTITNFKNWLNALLDQPNLDWSKTLVVFRERV